MITVEREVGTRAPLRKVAAYLSDFTNTADWNKVGDDGAEGMQRALDRLVPTGSSASTGRPKHAGEPGTA
ncbi:MAG: hypothetical protein ACR2I7_06125 [Geodermatophilaceae bacterium]